jgi:hypothetical protein
VQNKRGGSNLATEIKPIPTTWNGVTYRSRTEARWAVFLAALPIQAEYEAETYSLPSGLYLPDFWVPDWKFFIEIKGQEPTGEEKQKCLELSELSGNSVLLARGAPSDRFHRYFAKDPMLDGECWARFERCRRCWGFVLEMSWDRSGDDWAGRSFVGPHGSRCYDRGGEGVPQAALAKASNERFWVYPQNA